MTPKLWIFGYGSLVWRPTLPGFDVARPWWIARREGTIEGWTRRFWQGSTDHRGTPQRPGRVVTLRRQAGTMCHGVVYGVAEALVAEVTAQLDHREKGGYERHEVDVRTSEGSIAALVYVAAPGNPEDLGPAPIEAIAAQIRSAVGPSGPNPEYVERLASALQSMGAHDAHVFAVAAALRGTSD